MRPKRVALVIPSLSPGGAERAAINMAAAARALDCFVICERPDGELGATGAAKDIWFASPSEAHRGRIRRVANLVRALRQTKAELAVSMLSPVVTTVAADIVRIPVVHWLQNPIAHGLQAPVGRVLPPGSARLVSRAMLMWISRRAALFAGASPGLVEELGDLGVPARKLALLPNGVELPEPPRDARRAMTAGEARIVTVGRLAPQKRQDVLLEAFAQLRNDQAATLTIVGSGPLEGTLRRRADELGIAPLVRFTGFVTDPSEFLLESDLFVLSSDYEGFGNVMVEALGCGLPVVATDVPYGPRFILGDSGGLGALVPPGSPSTLAAGLRDVIGRLRAGEDFHTRARARAQAFSLERVAGQFEDLVQATFV
jgi:glycosyltransferase involved in cell wall biosynthesis